MQCDTTTQLNGYKKPRVDKWTQFGSMHAFAGLKKPDATPAVKASRLSRMGF
jgi:hypothetical protein